MSRTAQSGPVSIIGGGVAGLTSALCLARFGIASHIHERADRLEEVGAGLQLSPNAMQVLRLLGLEAALLARAVSPREIGLYEAKSNTRLATMPLGDIAAQRYGAPYCVIHRGDLQKVLVTACNANPHISLTLGSNIAPSDDLGLVIAADGVHSAWRAHVRTKHKATFSGMVAWRVTHDVTNPEEVTKVWFGPNAHLVDYPISGGAKRNLVAIARTGKLAGPDAAASLQSAFAKWHPAIRARLDEQTGWLPWPLNGVDPQAAWTRDNVALIGDAAHAMLPFAAQGAAMAIEDAWVLANQLATNGNKQSALTAYEKLRKPRVTRVWNEAAKNGKIYHLTGPMALARNAVLRASKPAGLLARYDWLYGWSPEEDGGAFSGGAANSSIAP